MKHATWHTHGTPRAHDPHRAACGALWLLLQEERMRAMSVRNAEAERLFKASPQGRPTVPTSGLAFGECVRAGRAAFASAACTRAHGTCSDCNQHLLPDTTRTLQRCLLPSLSPPRPLTHSHTAAQAHSQTCAPFIAHPAPPRPAPSSPSSPPPQEHLAELQGQLAWTQGALAALDGEHRELRGCSAGTIADLQARLGHLQRVCDEMQVGCWAVGHLMLTSTPPRARTCKRPYPSRATTTG